MDINKFPDYYKNYDELILKMMPFYPEMHKIMIESINKPIDSKFEILELGFGTGTLTYLILRSFPKSDILGIDNNIENIEISQKRLKRFANFRYKVNNIVNYKPKIKFDIIISSLAIHHLTDKEKELFFKRAYELLNPNGRIIIGDIVRSPKAEDWHKYLIFNLGEEGKYRWKIHKNNPLDKPSTLKKQIKWLKEAGFNKIEVMKNWYNFYVFRGEK